MPDRAGVGARAAQEPQRVHQQRLARAGLAGNDGQPIAERQFGVRVGPIVDRNLLRAGEKVRIAEVPAL